MNKFYAIMHIKEGILYSVKLGGYEVYVFDSQLQAFEALRDSRYIDKSEFEIIEVGICPCRHGW